MNPFVQKIGIDLGTANTLVFVPGKGVVVNEPSVVAISVLENKVLAVGNEAKEMIGRTPDTIVASQPLRDGAIADYRVTEAMLRYFIQKVSGRFRLIRPEVVLSIPAGVTSTERRAVIDAANKAGARAAYVVKEPNPRGHRGGNPHPYRAGEYDHQYRRWNVRNRGHLARWRGCVGVGTRRREPHRPGHLGLYQAQV